MPASNEVPPTPVLAPGPDAPLLPVAPPAPPQAPAAPDDPVEVVAIDAPPFDPPKSGRPLDCTDSLEQPRAIVAATLTEHQVFRLMMDLSSARLPDRAAPDPPSLRSDRVS
jgi:hypothetical protein